MMSLLLRETYKYLQISVKIFKPDTCTCLFEQQLDFSVASASFYPEVNEEVDWMRASQLYIASKDMVR